MKKNRNNLVRQMFTVILGMLFFGQLVLAQSTEVTDDEPAAFLDESDISWKVNDFNVARWKTLVGGSEGGQLENDDIQFGLWQLAPGLTYHGHKHDAPEVYYILSGEAEWTVGTKTKKVTAGTTIYTRPGKIHRMVNLTDEPVKTIWFWWAPEGKRKVFTGEYLFTEPAPKQPANSGFKLDLEDNRY